MTLGELRREMNRYWEQLDREALEMKDSHLVLNHFHALYRSLGPTDRALADQVLAEWVLSPDEARRFDAIALIREFGVTSAEPALRKLAARLEKSDKAGASFEREKVHGLLEELAGDGANQTGR